MREQDLPSPTYFSLLAAPPSQHFSGGQLLQQLKLQMKRCFLFVGELQLIPVCFFTCVVIVFPWKIKAFFSLSVQSICRSMLSFFKSNGVAAVELAAVGL